MEATFQSGKKIVDGKTSTVVRVKESRASNGIGKYYTFLWSDDTLSCDCRGWTIKKAGKERDCKHCKASRKCQYADMQLVSHFQTAAPAVMQAVKKAQTKRLAALDLS